MEKITISTQIDAPIDIVWTAWTEPEHITQWAFASEEWECPKAENDLQVDGTFTTTMAAKDGSMQFDIEGIYSTVEELSRIEYRMSDGREVITTFIVDGNRVDVEQQFDPEPNNSVEMQQQGWQAILDNFKKHVEKLRLQ